MRSMTVSMVASVKELRKNGFRKSFRIEQIIVEKGEREREAV